MCCSAEQWSGNPAAAAPQTPPPVEPLLLPVPVLVELWPLEPELLLEPLLEPVLAPLLEAPVLEAPPLEALPPSAP